MFLNRRKIKQLIKSSFRWEGLTVGRVYGGLVVAGGRWITWTEDGYIPNWLKAAVMEYTGELPKQGCMFKAKKDEPIQYEIADNDFYDLPEMKRKCIFAYTVTPVVIKDQHYQVRLLQQNTSGGILAVPETCCEIIDLSELGDENAPSGPASVSESGGILLYKNEHSAYAFTTLGWVMDETREIMDAVSAIDFSRSGEGK